MLLWNLLAEFAGVGCWEREGGRKLYKETVIPGNIHLLQFHM